MIRDWWWRPGTLVECSGWVTDSGRWHGCLVDKFWVRGKVVYWKWKCKL